jgi:hypothetical protein
MTAFPLSPLPVQKDPFDHIVQEQFMDPEVYQEIERSFPVCAASTGPTGFSYYWGDAEYQKLITENWAWKRFFETVHSQDFVRFCTAQFADAYREHGCRVDLDRAVYTPYCESRQDKERRHLEKVTQAPHELYVRLDVHQGHIGYRRASHVDHRRRVATMLFYFSDSDVTGREGGDLVLHRNYLRVLRPEAKRVRPQRNIMAGFACSQASYHSVPTIVSQSSPRNFVQVQLSSQVDAWPR